MLIISELLGRIEYFIHNKKRYMSKTIRIGIDPSINCTGVCVWDPDTGTHQYFMIPSKMTKKMKEFNNKYIHLAPYNKQQTDSQDYSIKEQTKFDNIYNICKIIDDIVAWQDDLEYDDYGFPEYLINEYASSPLLETFTFQNLGPSASLPLSITRIITVSRAMLLIESS